MVAQIAPVAGRPAESPIFSLRLWHVTQDSTLAEVARMTHVPVHILRQQNACLGLMGGEGVVRQGTELVCYELDVRKYRRKMINPFVTLMEAHTGGSNARDLMNYNPAHICNLAAAGPRARLHGLQHLRARRARWHNPDVRRVRIAVLVLQLVDH